MSALMTLVRPVVKRVVGTIYGPKYRIVTDTVNYGVLMAIGDAAVQRIERYSDPDKANKRHDWKRTGRLFMVGVMLGPVNHVWYKYLDRILPTRKPVVVVKKILLDQIVAAPVMVFGFFMATNLMEQRPLDKSLDEFRQKFWTVYTMDWLVWPPAQAINFRFVKPQYRVLYVTMITVFWDSFLSYVKHKDKSKRMAAIF